MLDKLRLSTKYIAMQLHNFSNAMLAALTDIEFRHLQAYSTTLNT